MARPRLRGEMLWFNDVKDVGALRTSAGERVEVTGSAFAPGERPPGRCAGAPVEFDEGDAGLSGITFVAEEERRRARRRHSR